MKLNKIAQLFLAWKRRKITKQIQLKSAYYSLLLMRANAKQLNEITKLVESGKIKTRIDKVFSLNEVLDALLYLKNGRTKGKVVIKIK